jgi:geranylgeranyl diphosphate synthase type II
MRLESFAAEIAAIEERLRQVLARSQACPLPQLEKFWESLAYSVFSPGKRFRPLLAVLTAKALGRSPEDVMPLACALELIHTYSLIHDDLPMLDDDDQRRGRPTNHKVYGDAMALLAGDGLLTLAFFVLTENPRPATAEAVRLLAEAAGIVGMVGGQVLDVEARAPEARLLEQIHRRKTGALIQVSVEGAAALLDAPADQRAALGRYGWNLGLAFQLADDLQDFDPQAPEKVSFVTSLGEAATRARLKQAGDEALKDLEIFGAAADPLRELIRGNFERA